MKEARRCLAVVLAAGEGTRMKSTLPKVLHRLAGRTMLAHVLATAAEADAVAVVVGPGRDDVAAEARRAVPGVEIFVQAERLGTAHAVLAAAAAIGRGFDDLLILYADVPLIAVKRCRRCGGLSRTGPGSWPSASRRAIRSATAACSRRPANSWRSASTRTRRMSSAPSRSATPA